MKKAAETNARSREIQAAAQNVVKRPILGTKTGSRLPNSVRKESEPRNNFAASRSSGQTAADQIEGAVPSLRSILSKIDALENELDQLDGVLAQRTDRSTIAKHREARQRKVGQLAEQCRTAQAIIDRCESLGAQLDWDRHTSRHQSLSLTGLGRDEEEGRDAPQATA